ncbi:helix-turn-helix domain-containing protein [Kitasatospora sp. NPDC002965]|uniref:helix-turn-helix domain-containing protein n=1 Tax=Kitasatospora sp. NPDC002965 TaxID=3154775 RepID=UPI0033A1FC9C
MDKAEERRRLLEAFPAERVAEESAAALVREAPAYAGRDEASLRRDMLGIVEAVLSTLRAGRELSAEESGRFEEFGALRAEQGIGLEPLLEAFRQTSRRAFDALYATARHHPDPAAALELTRELWACTDAVSIAMVRGHRRHEAERVRADQEYRTLLLKQLLLGELPPDWLPTAAGVLALDPRAEYRVCYARPEAGEDVREVERGLRGHLLVHLAEPAAQHVVGLTTGRPRWTVNLPVGLGPARPLARLNESLVQARRANELALAFGLRRPVVDGELPLHSAVLALPETGELLAGRCFGHVDGKRRRTLVTTLDAYLKAGANADAAAAALFVHPNTLRYRLRGFTAATGLDLAHGEDAMTVWWALRHLEAASRHREPPG